MEKVLRKYIDSNCKNGKEELRKLLQQTSSIDRYSLLMNVRGNKYNGNTGPNTAANYNDFESTKDMLKGLTGDQKYDVLKIQSGNGISALHHLAWGGYTSIITYLLTDLSQQGKYNLLQLQKIDGDTPLHDAASQQKSEAIQTILTSLSSQQQIQLLNIKNKKGQTVVDIGPEVYKEHPVLISLGIVILYILQQKYF